MPTFGFLLHAANLRHGTTGFTSPPKEGVLGNFSPWKNPTASAGFEPANLDTRGQHPSSRSPKPLCQTFHKSWKTLRVFEGSWVVLRVNAVTFDTCASIIHYVTGRCTARRSALTRTDRRITRDRHLRNVRRLWRLASGCNWIRNILKLGVYC
jgi:hypothetical protein